MVTTGYADEKSAAKALRELLLPAYEEEIIRAAAGDCRPA